MSEPPRLTRTERRRQTEARILDSARKLFARLGYERTTIRAVAGDARVDPALVMQYYGSKQKLFARAADLRLPTGREGEDGDPAGSGRDPEALIESLLTALGVKLDGLPATSLATLRSMLTHPEAGQIAREALDGHIAEVSGALGGADARLRAALLICTTVGVAIGHELLRLDALRDAPPERITELLRPALRTLIARETPQDA
ncbi:TetR/AcrR family transcriptional regulator [Streptomyces sp. SBT349]|uniref:TetR/AcrR family transcriptional regulator n=1 Tax=Streptomyces sp. SBT349 TaxID=1580539 RepID=UPI00066DEC5E|nr:TetR family transcriptional regulator [Streptomyces sp. SBT349]